MTKFARMTAVVLAACGALATTGSDSFAQDLHHAVHHHGQARYMSTGAVAPVQPAPATYGYGYGDTDSANAKNPALAGYQQNKGGETGGPARMLIPE